MQNLRKYGEPPFSAALVHGGPGAAGEMAPVARELADDYGILEPLQTAKSLEDQVTELKTVLEENADLPVNLVGFSWGAWLSWIVAARYPELVRKLILIGSGSFEKKYIKNVVFERMSRLNEAERDEFFYIENELQMKRPENLKMLFSRLGELLSQADAFDPIKIDNEKIVLRPTIFQKVWPVADKFRSTGKLLALASQIKCPVVALHGDYDSHPAEGVREPLSNYLPDFRFILLENCGHKPWAERQARDAFYRILTDELKK